MGITICLPGNKKDNIIKKSKGGFFIRDYITTKYKEALAVSINGKILDICDKIYNNNAITLVQTSTESGNSIIKHSCEHILANAVTQIFKNTKVAQGASNHSYEFYYDLEIDKRLNNKDLSVIEKKMQQIIRQKKLFKKRIIYKGHALDVFKKLKQPYKLKLINTIKPLKLSLYENNNFIDLCKGPHLPSTKFINAFKLLSISGTYWRNNSTNKMLQRIYGVAFYQNILLIKFLNLKKKSQKIDHRTIGNDMNLFIVSKIQNSHKHSISNNTQLSVLGNIGLSHTRKQDNQLNFLHKKMMQILSLIIYPKNLIINKYYLSHYQKRNNNLKFNIQIKITGLSEDNNRVKKLNLLEKLFNKNTKEGVFQFFIQNKIIEEIGPGLVNWMPNGGILRNIIEDFSKKSHIEKNYQIVYSPHIAKIDLWKISGHWDFYKKNMFPPMIIDQNEYILKPMNCPFHLLMYKNEPKSYKNLPIRLAEFGTVYRYEKTGVLHGLMRTRGFTQDDAHIFCRFKQIKHEIKKIINFILFIFKSFSFHKFEITISTKPKNSIGNKKKWIQSQSILRDLIHEEEINFNMDFGGGAFYGPKIDIKLQDSLNRMWQCSTIQLDFCTPKKFNINFINSNGKKKQPILIHRALFGSIERFIAILIEHYKGKFPIWLAPEQINIVTVSKKHNNYAKKIMNILKTLKVRIKLNKTSISLGSKIRKAQLINIPILIIIGDKEEINNGISVKLRDNKKNFFLPLEDLRIFIKKEIFIPMINLN